MINASLKGVIEECNKNRGTIGTLFGAINGIEGMLEEDLVDLSAEAPERVAELKGTPGAALGGCRYRLGSDDPEDPKVASVLNTFQKYDIRYFFYIGGNDSMDTALKLDNAAKKAGYGLKVIGIPKTIDNDLMETDHCPGYGSCARYLITSVIESGMHARSMSTSEPVTILVTVGRNGGWLPAACSMARQKEDDPPHILCLPEIAFNRRAFAEAVREAYKKYGFVYIATGEGIRDESGGYISAQGDTLSTDAFGHPKLDGVAEAMQQIVELDAGLKARVVKLDICQQAAVHLASGTDLDEAEECGRAAVRLALGGETGCMVTIDRISLSPYRAACGKAPLQNIANIDRTLPAAFIDGSGWVTEAFREYLAPLIGEQTKNNLKFYRGLAMHRVKKDLG